MVMPWCGHWPRRDTRLTWGQVRGIRGKGEMGPGRGNWGVGTGGEVGQTGGGGRWVLGRVLFILIWQ